MLWSAGLFSDFGPLTLGPDAATPRCQQIHGKHGRVPRSQVRLLCPHQPGVYGMVDEHGELIYIGKAKSLRVRLLSYFRPRSRGKKATRIMRLTAMLVWESCPSEFAALLRELELIRRWRPRWNVQGQPLRLQKTFLCVGRQPAPYVFLARRPPLAALATFGPIPAGRRAVDAVARVNDLFQLRDCPQAQEMIFPDQGGLYSLERPPGCCASKLAPASVPAQAPAGARFTAPGCGQRKAFSPAPTSRPWKTWQKPWPLPRRPNSLSAPLSCATSWQLLPGLPRAWSASGTPGRGCPSFIP